MGYTNYWVFKGNRGYQKALLDIKKFIETVVEIEPALLADGEGVAGTTPELRIYSSSSFSRQCISFNGVGSAGHESFSLTSKCPFVKGEGHFDCCKTAQKPYDVVVTACLVILKHHMGNNVEIHSDGGVEAFNEGRELVKRLLNIDME